MAKMYPNIPREFDPKSKEDQIFKALESLPDTYYVFHSFSIVNTSNNTVKESEADFVVFHPRKGILCIEAKAGAVKYENGQWKYGSGIIMKHDGPFRQASKNKYNLMDYFDSQGLSWILSRCKFVHGVWFPSVDRKHFQGINLPPEADSKLMLTREHLDNANDGISKLLDMDVPSGIKTDLNSAEVELIINRVLAPSFNLISLPEIEMDHRKDVFRAMLKEQVSLLNYLEDQPTAIINGMAGTGKTVVAVEQARRKSDKGDKVLFLCYNAYLKERLQQIYPYENVDYFTIDGLACKLCRSQEPNYLLLKEKLEDYYLEGNFPYKHIVIDEGQDFGKDKIQECGIISLLKANVVDDEKNGTFYLFYDKNQMVQSQCMPEYISSADCKLTLYRNCRNTVNIATTSMRLLGSDKQPRMFEGSIRGELADMIATCNLANTVSVINNTIEECCESGYNDIVILTCKTEASSIIAKECSGGVYCYKKRQIPFTTCRKFKGLEAEVVILVDVDSSSHSATNDRLLYVGSSRAKFKLVIIANMSSEDCDKMLIQLGEKKRKNSGKAIATLWNAKYKEV